MNLPRVLGLPASVLIAFSLACSSNSGNGSAEGGATSDAFNEQDAIEEGATQDAAMGVIDAANDAAMDAGDEGAAGQAGSSGDGSVDGGSGCHALTEVDSNQQCSWTGVASCSSLAGTTPGSCPSSGLAGCCVVTQFLQDGGQTSTATCYYASDAAVAIQDCAIESYVQQAGIWQTSAP